MTEQIPILAKIEALRVAHQQEGDIEIALPQVTADGICRECRMPHYIGNGSSYLECVDGNVCSSEKYIEVKALWPKLKERQLMREAGQFICPNLSRNMRAEGLPGQKPFEVEQSAALAKAKGEIIAYGRRLVSNQKTGSLLICGPTGSGKSHLCRNLHDQVGMEGKPVKFSRVALLSQQLDEARRFRSENSFELILADLTNCRLLILDDLGAEAPSTSETLNTALLLILDQCEMQEGFSVAITANFPPDQLLPKYGERITSRLRNECSGFRGGETIVFKGEGDYRKHLAKGGAKTNE